MSRDNPLLESYLLIALHNIKDMDKRDSLKELYPNMPVSLHFDVAVEAMVRADAILKMTDAEYTSPHIMGLVTMVAGKQQLRADISPVHHTGQFTTLKKSRSTKSWNLKNR